MTIPLAILMLIDPNNATEQKMDNVVDANLKANWTTLSTAGRFETLKKYLYFSKRYKIF
jgi:hypothetical protein